MLGGPSMIVGPCFQQSLIINSLPFHGRRASYEDVHPVDDVNASFDDILVFWVVQIHHTSRRAGGGARVGWGGGG